MFDQEPGDEGDASLAALCGVLHAATASIVAMLAEVLSIDAWNVAGIHSPVHWVTWRCGVSSSRARSWVRMCPRHHRAHHRGELVIEGDPRAPDGLVVTDTRTGRVLTPLAGPSPPAEPPADAACSLGVAEAGWRHPSGARLDRRWVVFARAG